MKQELENMFVVLWKDDNGNGTFGKFTGIFTEEEAIESIINDIYQVDIDEDTEEEEKLEILKEKEIKCENYRKELKEQKFLTLPGIISYSIEGIL